MNGIFVNHIGYLVEGIVTVELWGGEIVNIDMKPYKIDEVTRENIVRGVNDNGFGVKSFIDVEVHIFDLYERGVEEYLEQREYEFTKEENQGLCFGFKSE